MTGLFSLISIRLLWLNLAIPPNEINAHQNHDLASRESWEAAFRKKTNCIYRKWFYELLSMHNSMTLKEGQQSELPHHLKKRKKKKKGGGGTFPPAYNESEQEQQQLTYNKQCWKHIVKTMYML